MVSGFFVAFGMRCAGLLLAIGYLGLLQPVWAQTGVPAKTQHARYLVLERKWPFKRIRVYPGEKLAFKLKHEAITWAALPHFLQTA